MASKCSSRQCAVTCSSSHGPRARISGAAWPARAAAGHRPKASECRLAADGRDRRAAHRLARVTARSAQALGMGLRGPAAHARAGARRRPALLAQRLGIAPGEIEDPVALEERRAGGAPRVPPARAGRRSARADAHARARMRSGKSYADVVRGFRGPLRAPARPRRAPARRGGGRARARVVLGERRGRDPVRRRHVGRRRRHARRRPRATTAPSRSTSARWTACSRSTRSRAPRASRPARSARRSRRSSPSTGSRCATSRSRSSSRRSAAGSPRARPATSRRVWTHIEDFVESVRAITPGGHVGVAAAARLGRRGQPRPHARRLGGRRSA